MPRISQLAMSLPGSPEPWKRVSPENWPAKLLVRLGAVVLPRVTPSTVDTAPVVRAWDVPKNAPGTAGSAVWSESVGTGSCTVPAAVAAVSETIPIRSNGIMINLFIIVIVFSEKTCGN